MSIFNVRGLKVLATHQKPKRNEACNKLYPSDGSKEFDYTLGHNNTHPPLP
jgi:hypothetical protein